MKFNALQLPAPAKLNLFLHINGRRRDGSHDLQTVFQLLDLSDDIEMEVADGPDIRLDCPGLDLPIEENLAWRAAQLLQRHIRGQAGARIRIRKRIPVGGGLGGGSSDAASVLRGLNRLWGAGLREDELAALGKRLGADVPVFVRGRSAWAAGTGERLAPIALPPRHYLIIAPDCEVSTAKIFAHRELTRDTAPITMPAFLKGVGRNDCEQVVRRLYPPVDAAMKWLEKFARPRLTGTGACVFADFSQEAAAEAVRQRVPEPWRSFVAKGLNRSLAAV